MYVDGLKILLSNFVIIYLLSYEITEASTKRKKNVHDPLRPCSSLRRSATTGAAVATASLSEPVTMGTTASALARAFGVVVRQVRSRLITTFSPGQSPNSFDCRSPTCWPSCRTTTGRPRPPSPSRARSTSPTRSPSTCSCSSSTRDAIQ